MQNLFKGQNIQLRPLEKEDLDLLYKWENDTGIWHLSNTRIPFARYTLSNFIDSTHKDIYEAKQLRLVIQHRETNKSLGTVDLFDFDPYNLRAGLGILIADKNDRKKGFASESIDLIITYGSEILSLKQLYCNILENNEDSLKLFISKGFVISGSKKDWLKIKNEWITEFTLQRLYY